MNKVDAEIEKLEAETSKVTDLAQAYLDSGSSTCSLSKHRLSRLFKSASKPETPKGQTVVNEKAHDLNRNVK